MPCDSSVSTKDGHAGMPVLLEHVHFLPIHLSMVVSALVIIDYSPPMSVSTEPLLVEDSQDTVRVTL